MTAARMTTNSHHGGTMNRSTITRGALALTAAGMTGLLLVVAAPDAKATPDASGCEVIVIASNPASGTYTVATNAAACTVPVTVSSYRVLGDYRGGGYGAPGSRPQRQYDVYRINATVTERTVHVRVPACGPYQTDLYRGGEVGGLGPQSPGHSTFLAGGIFVGAPCHTASPPPVPPIPTTSHPTPTVPAPTTSRPVPVPSHTHTAVPLPPVVTTPPDKGDSRDETPADNGGNLSTPVKPHATLAPRIPVKNAAEQVTVIPQGAPDTGGGGTSGVESAGLLGLGGALFVGGSALILFGWKRVTR